MASFSDAFISETKNIFTIFFFFFLHLLNLGSILNRFKKKMTLIAYVFVNLGTLKNVVR